MIDDNVVNVVVAVPTVEVAVIVTSEPVSQWLVLAVTLADELVDGIVTEVGHVENWDGSLFDRFTTTLPVTPDCVLSIDT